MRTFAFLFATVSALLGQTLHASAQGGIDRELVVREVFLPRTGIWESHWSLPAVLADPTSSSSTSLFANETLRGPGYLTGNPLGPSRIVIDSSRTVIGGIDSKSIKEWGSSLGDSRCAMIGTPFGVEFVVMDEAQQPNLKAWWVDTGTFSRWIPHPPSPNGMPAFSGFYFLTNAGDLNQDGWDEIFFQDRAVTGEGVAGCLDGQSADLLWASYFDDHNIPSRIAWNYPGSPHDLNGDGIGDFLYGDEIVQGILLQHRILALSGADGSLIWERTLNRSFISRHTISTPDLNGDQINDLISLNGADFRQGRNGQISAISGATGSLIWERDCSFFPSLYPTATQHSVGSPLIVSPSPDGLGLDLIVYGNFTDNGNWWQEAVFLYLDAKSGTFLTNLAITGDLSPWHSNAIDLDLAPVTYAGDFDGDGYQELAAGTYLIGEDSNSTSIYPHAMLIVGQRTLTGPANPKIGAIEEFSLSMPGHPNAPFQLAFSPGFSHRNDKAIWAPQKWPTQLRNSSVVHRTSRMSSLSGNLDGLGQGTINVQFPSNPAYIGIPFYARALIGNPSNPTEIATQSSLLSLELAP